jgi:hypothetical protein
MDGNMTTSSSRETQQERASEHAEGQGERSDHGRTGEGAASALQYLISQDQHRKQARESAAPSGAGVHP